MAVVTARDSDQGMLMVGNVGINRICGISDHRVTVHQHSMVNHWSDGTNSIATMNRHWKNVRPIYNTF